MLKKSTSYQSPTCLEFVIRPIETILASSGAIGTYETNMLEGYDIDDESIYD